MKLLEPVLEYPHLPEVIVDALRNELGDYFIALNEEIQQKQFKSVFSEQTIYGPKTVFIKDATKIIKQRTEDQTWWEIHSSDHERFDFPDGFFRHWTLRGVEKIVELSVDWKLKDGIPNFEKGKTLRITHRTPNNTITRLDFFVNNLKQSGGRWIEITKRFDDIYDKTLETPKFTNFPELKNNILVRSQYLSPEGEETAALVKIGIESNGLFEGSLISDFRERSNNVYDNSIGLEFYKGRKNLEFDLNGGEVKFPRTLQMKDMLKIITIFD